MDIPLIFVGGCERSGTSLLQKILLAHPEIAGGPEFIFTGRIAALYRQMAAEYPPPYADRLAAHFDPARLAQRFRDFYGSFFADLAAERPGAQHIAEKTPSNIFAAPDLLALFPDSRFVHIIRDARDVLVSHRDVLRRLREQHVRNYRASSFRTLRICARWRRAMAVHFALEADPPSGRYYALRFEDLVGEPQRALASLFGFIGLDVPELAYTPEAITEAHTGVPLDGVWTTAESYRQPYAAHRIGRWRRELPLRSRLATDLLLSDPLHRLGYDTSAVWRPPSRGIDRVLDRVWPRGPFGASI